MGVMEMNENEPLKTPRKAQLLSKLAEDVRAKISLEETCLLSKRQPG